LSLYKFQWQAVVLVITFGFHNKVFSGIVGYTVRADGELLYHEVWEGSPSLSTMTVCSVVYCRDMDSSVWGKQCIHNFGSITL